MSGQFRESFLRAGIVLGIATAVITLFAKSTTLLSENSFIAALQKIVLIPSLPGLFGAAIIGSLAVGAAINLVLYSLLGGLSVLLFRKKDGPNAL